MVLGKMLLRMHILLNMHGRVFLFGRIHSDLVDWSRACFEQVAEDAAAEDAEAAEA